MAKKSAAPAPHLVHIPSLSADNAALSKAQKEFNRLTKRIAKLEKDVTAFREAATRLRQRVQTEYRPLQTQHNDQRAAMVRQLDRAYDTYKLTKTERNKIVDLIVNGCFDLIERGYDELKPIFDKHEPQGYDEADAEADAQTAEMMKQLFAQQFGIVFDPAADVSTKEKFQAYVDQQLAEQEQQFAAQEEAQAQRRAQRRKSPKQQAAEAKKQAEEKNITKAVRTLYMDLVKVLHPDAEPDEAEKARKTVLLQQVTTAYEANELLTLLRLQLELQRIDQTHLENLAEDQLRYYNKLLREQVRELDEALYGEQMNLADFTGQPYYLLPTPAALDYDYQRQKTQLEAKIRQLAAEVLAFERDPAALKAFLKTHRIQKAGQGPILVQL
ncbi:MAG: hypothetical protein H7Z21_01255 [Hymenobacter sp.]|nr:hypothetical protein [Hymenobacter sp.]